MANRLNLKFRFLINGSLVIALISLAVLINGSIAIYSIDRLFGGLWFLNLPEWDQPLINRFSLSGHQTIHIEVVDSISNSVSIVRFSKDGTSYNDSIMFRINETGYAVLYFNASDTIYFDSTDYISLLSYGEDDFKFEFARENYTDNNNWSANSDLWKVRENTWASSGYPKLRPIATVEEVFIHHKFYIPARQPSSPTQFIQNDSAGNLIINPNL